MSSDDDKSENLGYMTLAKRRRRSDIVAVTD